jgi:hypothetical protein
MSDCKEDASKECIELGSEPDSSNGVQLGLKNTSTQVGDWNRETGKALMPGMEDLGHRTRNISSMLGLPRHDSGDARTRYTPWRRDQLFMRQSRGNEFHFDSPVCITDHRERATGYNYRRSIIRSRPTEYPHFQKYPMEKSGSGPCSCDKPSGNITSLLRDTHLGGQKQASSRDVKDRIGMQGILCTENRPRIWYQKERAAPEYDGKANWEDFHIQFEIIAEMNGWDYSRRAAELAASLRGPALKVLSSLNSPDRGDYETLTRALNSRFNSYGNEGEIHKANLRTRKRQQGESLAELAQEIRVLVRKAYPKATGEIYEELTIAAFTEALSDTDLEWTVVNSCPTTSEEALTVATRLEAFRLARQKKQEHQEVHAIIEGNQGMADLKKIISRQCSPSFSIDHQTSGLSVEVGYNRLKCHICKQDGHLAVNCPNKMPKMRKKKNCFYCHLPGHTVSVCPVVKSLELLAAKVKNNQDEQ